MKYQVNEKKVAYFYTFLVMVLFSIPTYFAVVFSFEKELILKELALEKFTNDLERKIYSENMDLSRSVKIKFALFDDNMQIISSSLSEKLDYYDFKTYIDYPYMYYKQEIEYKNRYNARYIISEVQINYAKMIFIAILLFLVILANIYILNKVIIKNTARPYELMQKYTNSFFNDTMHELKTPLGVININLDLLVQKTEANKYTKRMKTALKQIQITYEDIEYHIKNKKVKYIKEKLNISSLLYSRIDFFEDVANSKAIYFDVNIDKECYVFMNSLEFQRVVDNTLSNAIKYSNPKNKIEIKLENKNDISRLSIKDYGHGIKNIKSAFNRFDRQDEVQGGFGLGLNIIKNIANKNGIKIDVETKVDEGSTFIYEFRNYKKKFLDGVEDDS
ncbi:two-component sensor histidine kinase [Malaciobacter canalis]|uniref:histidine kinase n=1 Tax=Malaciobacter canalis TaxID=1912871 RepID=A0ABX4LS88_9BACT|nr:HAMP domain-containing sensor histidine kinase [Malaciobacter canalis]PHO10792.1 two-component sensor histidine kinase [Malaciobacter canalis]QEE33948.1 two-component system sensor histidine kinase [Malaciobacter canalis]